MPLHAQEPIILTDGRGEYPLGLHLEILEDTEGRWTIEDVTSPEIARQFVPSRSGVPNFGFTTSVYWVRFRVKNEASQIHQWRLEMQFSNMNQIHLYLSSPDQQRFEVKHTGNVLPFTTRDVLHHHFIFRVSFVPHTEHTIYLRFESEGAMTLPLTLWSLEAFARKNHTEQFGLGLFYGTLLLMLSYNVFLLYSLREQRYVYYVLFLISLLLVLASYDGLALQFLWPNFARWNLHFILFATGLAIISALKFTSTFFKTNVYLPKLHLIIIILVAICGGLMVFVPFVNYRSIIRPLLVLVFPGFVVVLVASVASWQKRLYPISVLLVWSTFLVTPIIFILLRFGLLASNVFTEHSLRLGVILLVLPLSLMLIHIITQEKEEAQAEVLQKHQEALRRTAKLARTNEALHAEITERKRIEEALRESEEKYRRLIEHANEIIVVIQDGRLKLVNPAAIEHTGYSREELFSGPFIEFIHPDDRGGVLQRYRKRQQGEQIPEAYPVRIVHKAGAVRWLEVRAVVIEWEGKPATLTFLNDITERKRAEEELTTYKNSLEKLFEQRTTELIQTNKQLAQEAIEHRRTEQALAKQSALLNEVFRGIQEGVGIVDEHEVIVFCNPKYAEIFEEDIEELIGKDLLSFFDAETRSMLLQQTEIRKTGESSTYEVLLITRRGKKKYIQATVSPRLSKEGVYSGAFGVVLDITERKRAEKALAEMALFAEMNPAPILRTDLDGTITLANRAANTLFKVHHLIGNSWLALCPAVDRKNFDQLLSGKPLQHEYRIGEKNFLFTYLSNVDYGLVHIYGTDITRLKQLEAQLFQSQKMEAIGQLAGGIAHDFNTLLGIILGHGDMMRDDIPEESSIRDNLEGIINAGNRAKALVRQLLDFARPSTRDRHPIRLASLMEDAVRLLRSSLPTTITIQQRIETGSSMIRANSTQIVQAIMNLGMNAGDAIGEQGGELDITLADIDVNREFASFQAVSPGTYVRLSVNDTGCGMSPETLKHIFEPFFTTKEVGKGSGLGLSVVHGIVKSHEGFITVESEPGKGSSFQVYLPTIDY